MKLTAEYEKKEEKVQVVVAEVELELNLRGAKVCVQLLSQLSVIEYCMSVGSFVCLVLAIGSGAYKDP